MKKILLSLLISMPLSSQLLANDQMSVKALDTQRANLVSTSFSKDLLSIPTDSEMILPGHLRPSLKYGTGLDPKRIEESEFRDSPNKRLMDLKDSFRGLQEKAGPGVGGGGDIVQKPNGKIEIADAYEALAVFHDSARPVSLKENADFKELRRFVGLASGIDLVPGFASPKVLDESIQYFFVDTIPTDLEICKHGMSYKLDITDGSKIIRAACTDINDKNTYLVENFFRQLTPVEQLVLLYHEDMRRYGVPNGVIAIISRSLRFLIPILESQLQGKFRVLTQQELNSIRELFGSLARIGLFDTSLFGDKKFSNDQFLKKYRLTEFGGWVQSSVQLTLDQKVGIFATYWQSSDKVRLPNQFSLVATNICDFRHDCELKENQAIVGNVVLTDVLVEGKVPVTSFWSDDWGNIPSETKQLRLELLVNGAMIANSGFVIFKKAPDSSEWQVVGKGLLETTGTRPTILTTKFSFESGFQYVVRFQGQAHRPSVVVPGIALQSLYLQMKLIGENGEKILDSGRVKVVTNKVDPDAILTPFTAINGQIYFKADGQ